MSEEIGVRDAYLPSQLTARRKPEEETCCRRSARGTRSDGESRIRGEEGREASFEFEEGSTEILAASKGTARLDILEASWDVVWEASLKQAEKVLRVTAIVDWTGAQTQGQTTGTSGREKRGRWEEEERGNEPFDGVAKSRHSC
ncbi:hypothetical protein DFH06DRAFT_1135903 [Mycena polygramma]|nr:hypothetical protein DFH06DRAFT_1135903 [Mycena polygramma]